MSNSTKLTKIDTQQGCVDFGIKEDIESNSQNTNKLMVTLLCGGPSREVEINSPDDVRSAIVTSLEKQLEDSANDLKEASAS